MIVAVTGQKGGVGKTTVCLSLATEAQARGLAVLLVDADPQGSIRTWGIVADQQGQPTPTLVAMDAGLYKPDQLPRLAAGFDLVVIDCPPRADDVQRAALMVCDLALLPCGPAALDAWALAKSLETIAEARRLRPDLAAAIVVTRKQGRTALGQGAREVLAQSGLPVLKSELGYRIGYQEAIAAGQGPTTHAPRSEAAKEVRALLDEVLAMGPQAARPAPVKAPRGTTHGKQEAPAKRPRKAR